MKPLLDCWYASHSAPWKWKYAIYQEPINFIRGPINLLKADYLSPLTNGLYFLFTLPFVLLRCEALKPYSTCALAALASQRGRNQQQMSERSAPSMNHPACTVSSALVIQLTGHILASPISANSEDKECCVLLRCAPTSRVSGLTQVRSTFVCWQNR